MKQNKLTPLQEYKIVKFGQAEITKKAGSLDSYLQVRFEIECDELFKITHVPGKHAENILKMVKKREGFCPCKKEETFDTFCPCKEMVESGDCECTLWIKNIDK